MFLMLWLLLRVLEVVTSKVKGQVKVQVKVKVKTGLGLRRVSAPSGNGRDFPGVVGSVSAPAVGEVGGSAPLGRFDSPTGTAPGPGGKVRAVAVGWSASGFVQART